MIYAVERYTLIGLYTFLLVLVIVNIWTILIKQKRCKTLPLVAFYIFAFLAIAFRLIYILIDWTFVRVPVRLINNFYLITKLSVGLIQSWIILEIALRVRQTYKSSNSAE